MLPTGTFCEKSDEVGRPLGKEECRLINRAEAETHYQDAELDEDIC